LHNEISKEISKNPAIQLVELTQLTPNDFSEEVLQKAKQYILKVKKYYIKQYNRLTNQKDQLIAKSTRNATLRDAFLAKSQKYHNKTVEELVKNSEEINRIVEVHDHLVQKIYPIYLDPPATAWWDFRSHFYAPRKYIFGHYYDTLWFNISFIWLMSVILYGTLFFRVFHETIKTFTVLFTPKRKKHR
jgi:ABC transport system ATP-binding/permease protein